VFVAIAVSVPVLTSLGYRPHLESRLLWPGFALTFAVISLVSGRKQKSALLLWFGVYCACLAPLLWWIPGNSYYRGAWLAVGMGAPLACAGAIRLRSFLKATPVAADHPDE
jgi:hypothetical protein